MMTSSLQRMFNLAKATGADARENYTTEALAAAIRIDPSPIIAALKEIGIDGIDGVASVETQVPIEGGILDLVLLPTGRRTGRVWIEVKVNASVDETQIAKYLHAIAKYPVENKPVLVMLVPRNAVVANPKSSIREALWIGWDTLRKNIPSTLKIWRDFRAYLADIRMADDWSGPITNQEAAMISESHALLHKVARLLVPVVEHAKKVWPESKWPEGEPEILKTMAHRFAKWPSYTIQAANFGYRGVSMGVFDESEAMVGIWVWVNPKRVELREKVLATAKSSLQVGWKADVASWELLKASRELAVFRNSEEAAEWLKARLDDLKKAGLFLVIDAGAGPLTDEDGNGEGGDSDG